MRSLMIPSFVAATLLSGQTAPPQVSPDEAVSLTTPTLTLSGSLRLPITTGKVPVAIIIAGSGPTNRDGNSRMLPGNNNAYNQDGELTWLPWEHDEWQDDLLEVTRQLIQLRRENPALRPVRYGMWGETVPSATQMDWYNKQGLAMSEKD